MIYLDNSATTRQYDEVTKIMLRYMEEDFGNPSSLYQLGVDAEKALKKARRQMEQAIGAGEGKIFFTSGGTEADNMAVLGAVRSLKRSGNKIITSKVEHPAVLECFKRLEREGLDVVYIGVDRKCRLDREALESAIDDKTILVSLMHVNNESGTLMPLEEAKAIMKRKKAPGVLHCDAVQSFGKMKAPTCADMISISGHKLHGPKGTGALFIKKGLNIPALMEGGGQEEGKRSGTQNVPAIVGMGLAAQMAYDTLGEDMERMEVLRDKLCQGLLSEVGDIVINSPEQAGILPGQCCPSLLNVTFLGTRGEVLLHTLEQDGIYVSTGSACSSNKKGQSHVLKAMGLKDKEIEGTLRFSLGKLNTESEMEMTVNKTAEAVKMFRRLGSFR
ncbi:MAG: cysteine desulfurase [Clostridiales bacterium]|nr:cysteine desulfurase [Clostridiales bacterium]